MDLNTLRRHETARRLYSGAVNAYQGTRQGAKKIVERRVERREEGRRGKVDEVLARRTDLNRRAVDINTLHGRSTREPIIILGRLKPQSDTYVAVTLNTRYSKSRPSGVKEEDGPIAYFYKVNRADLGQLQANPFDKEKLELCECMEKEPALLKGEVEDLKSSLYTKTPKVPDEVFNPLGALHVAVGVRLSSWFLDKFEQSLDIIEVAMQNRRLNPQLAQMLKEPVPEQLPVTAAA